MGYNIKKKLKIECCTVKRETQFKMFKNKHKFELKNYTIKKLSEQSK